MVIPGLPQSKVLQNFLDERIILNKGYHLHSALALRTQQWINLINFLYQPSPIFTEGFGRNIVLVQGRHLIIATGLFAHTARLIGIVTIIAHHLLAFAGDVGDQLGQSIHGIKGF